MGAGGGILGGGICAPEAGFLVWRSMYHLIGK